MTTCIFCMSGVDYTYIDINAVAQGIKSFLARQVWFQVFAILGDQTPRGPCMYVCMCTLVCIDVSLYLYGVCMSGLTIHSHI